MKNMAGCFFCVIGNSLLHKRHYGANDARSREDVDCRKRPCGAQRMRRFTGNMKNAILA